MSDNVRVPRGDSISDTATLLLAAAEEKDLPASVVTVSSLGGFLVPEEIAKAAGLDYEDPDLADGSKYSQEQVDDAGEVEQPTDDSAGAVTEVEEAPKPAKKTAAKKTAAKGK